jgi:hypothetical protein
VNGGICKKYITYKFAKKTSKLENFVVSSENVIADIPFNTFLPWRQRKVAFLFR